MKSTLSNSISVDPPANQTHGPTDLTTDAAHAQARFYRELFESAPFGCLLTNGDGIIQEANHAAAHMLGLPKHDLVDRPLLNFVVAETNERQQFMDQLARLGAGQANHAWAMRFQTAQAGVFYAAVNVSAVANHEASANMPLLRWVLRDITRPIRTEGMLSQSEQKLRGIFENSADGFGLVDEHGWIIEWNDSMERITGLPRAQALGRLYFDLISQLVAEPQLAQDLIARIRARLTATTLWSGSTAEVEIQRPDGTRRVIQQSVYPIQTAQGLMLGNIVRDITERREMENALRAANEKLEARVQERTHALTQAIHDLVAEIARRQAVEDALRHRLRIEKVISHISNRFVNLDIAEIESEIDRTLQQVGETLAVDRTYVALLALDETEFAQVFEWCAESVEARASDVLTMSRQSVARYLDKIKRDSLILAPSPAQWHGMTPEEIDLLQRRRVQGFILVPMLYRGKLIGVFGCDTARAVKTWLAEDIAMLQLVAEIFANSVEHQRIAQALHQSERRQAAILNSVPVILYTFELRDGYPTLTWMSSNVEQITGFPASRFLTDRMFWLTQMHPDDRTQVVERLNDFDQYLATPSEYRWQCADGSYHWFLDRIVRMTQNKVTEYAGTWLDITRRKRAEQEEHDQRLLAEVLRDTAESFNNTLDTNQVFTRLLANVARLVPCDGVNVMLAAQGLPHLFAWRGYDKVALPNLGSDPDAAGSRPSFLRMFETGQPLLISDTTQDTLWETGLDSAWVRSYIGMPLRALGKTVGFLNVDSATPGFFNATHMDRLKAITDQASVALSNAQLFAETRHKAEQLRVLSRRLVEAQESERSRLARELHDEIGQTLTALMVDLHYIERHANQTDLLQGRTADAKQLVNKALEDLHQLVSDLRPLGLEHLGLVAALRQYVDDFGRQYDITVEFGEIGLGQARLPGDIEIALYRIAQEALTNVARHARARSTQVLLTQRADWLSLVIWDDGVGFDPSQPRVKDRMGVTGMRERAEMLGGRFTIESQIDAGTTVRVEVPYVRTHPHRG